MDSSLFYITSGLTLGASAGLLPGPLLALLVSETVRHGKREGFKIAAVPMITDLPIICIAFLVIAVMTNLHLFSGILSLAGAAYLFYLGVESLTLKKGIIEGEEKKPMSLRRGMVTNLLNPHPYMFWVTVGAPLVLRGYDVSALAAAGFVAGFYAGIVGSKMGVALAVDRARGFMKGRSYLIVLKILGALLIGFAAILCIEGIGSLRGNGSGSTPPKDAAFHSKGNAGIMHVYYDGGNEHDPV